MPGFELARKGVAIAHHLTRHSRVPLVFSLGKAMIRLNIPGGWRLLTAAHRFGWLDGLIEVPYVSNSRLWVPLDWKWFWLHSHLAEYEPNTLRFFAAEVGRRKADKLVFFDCGAHIGLVTSYMVNSCSNIELAACFDPDPIIFPVLQANCASLAVPALAINKGVNDIGGSARLVRPLDIEDGAYVVNAEGGNIPLTRIDDFATPPRVGVAMKIDVEGGELAVLKGSLETLRQAPFFIVLFEAHRDVMLRTGVDPMECVRFLNSIRPCDWMPSAQPDFVLDLERPFFEQMPDAAKRDILVWSKRPLAH